MKVAAPTVIRRSWKSKIMYVMSMKIVTDKNLFRVKLYFKCIIQRNKVVAYFSNPEVNDCRVDGIFTQRPLQYDYW